MRKKGCREWQITVWKQEIKTASEEIKEGKTTPELAGREIISAAEL